MTHIAAEREGLIADIVANPEDDTRRLIFADWCEDSGELDRAEFIRVEVDISRICRGSRDDKPEEDAGRLDALLRRQSELMFGVWEMGWLNPLPREYISGSVHSGGFLSTARLPLAAWMEHGKRLVREHPLTRVELSDKRPRRYGGVGLMVNWFAWGSGHLEREYHLPVPLASFLRGQELANLWVYETAALAIDALSDALLAWARATEPGDANDEAPAA